MSAESTDNPFLPPSASTEPPSRPFWHLVGLWRLIPVALAVGIVMSFVTVAREFSIGLPWYPEPIVGLIIMAVVSGFLTMSFGAVDGILSVLARATGYQILTWGCYFPGLQVLSGQKLTQTDFEFAAPFVGGSWAAGLVAAFVMAFLKRARRRQAIER